jgi:hypothetical protein
MIDLTEIQKMKDELTSLDSKIHGIEKEIFKKKVEIVSKVLENENILNENEWILNSDTTIISNTDKHQTLRDLLQYDHHCNYDLDDFMLCFDDWDITINFMKKEFLQTFIKTRHIKLNTNSIETQIDRLKRSIESDTNLLQKCEEQLQEIKNYDKLK